MELDDLKDIWLKEKKDLENKLTFNEKLVREMSLDKSRSLFNGLIKGAVLGRNSAFTNMIIAIILASKVFYEFEYSIPAYIGGIAMLVSFIQRMSFTKPDLSKMNTIELQKALCQFKIYISKISRYDAPCGILYISTLTPIFLKYILKIHVSNLSLYSIIVLLILLMSVLGKYMWKKVDKYTEEIEEQLNQILEFEKNN